MKRQITLLLGSIALSLPLSQAQTAVSPAAGPTAVVGEVPPEGFVMMGGKVFVVRRGQAVPLDGEMVLRVSPGGITGFDNIPRQLTENNMLTMDGRVVAVPPGIVVAPPQPRPDPADARLNDRGVSGENTTGLAPATAAPMPAVRTPAPVPPSVRTTATLPGAATGEAPTSQATTTVTTSVTAPPSVPGAVAAPVPGRGTAVPGAAGDRFRSGAPTTFDPSQVNDGSIEAAGTGARRRSVD